MRTRTTSAACPTCCGSVPDIPLVGSRLTLALVKSKLTEHRIMPDDSRGRGGRPTASSARGSWSSSRSTTRFPTRSRSRSRSAAGVILHTGDFKMDQLPLDGRLTDLGGFARLGAEGVDLLLADSTNAEVPGIVTSERVIGPVLSDVFVGRRAAHHRVLLRQPRAPGAAGHGRRRRARPQGRAGRAVDGQEHGRRPRPRLPQDAVGARRPARRPQRGRGDAARTRSC